MYLIDITQMEYELIAGLEIHLQTKTKSKMYCGCSAEYFEKEPNTNVCPVCLGLPGALPVPNKKAVEQCYKLAYALGCDLCEYVKFDRKNYFYPDLPKGFQISQYDKPIGSSGRLNISFDYPSVTIGITRVHQEEDTAKTLVSKSGRLIDFNKSGVPLVEIVTEPEFRKVEELYQFAEHLRLLVRYLGISDADMEKGEMRFEPNISLRPIGQKELPDYKVEIKNVSSISVLPKVVQREYDRQVKLLKKGEKPKQETRGLVDMSGETRSMRTKGGEADYRYFPEPDIPATSIDKESLEERFDKVITLPSERYDLFVNNHGIRSDMAKILTEKKEMGDFLLDSLEESNIDAGEYAIYIINQGEGVVNSRAEEVIENFKESKKVVEVADDKASQIVNEVIDNNPEIVQDYIDGKENAFNFLMGQCMRQLKDKADAKVIIKSLKKELNSLKTSDE